MCIVAVKPKGISMPKSSTIRTMFENNNNGAGYMIKRAGGAVIELKKGFFKVKHLLKSLHKENIELDDTVVIHFRIATSGGIKPEMCHPFVASPDPNIANSISGHIMDLCFAHNGVIYDLNGLSKDYSDTSLFAMQFLSDPAIKYSIFSSTSLQKVITKFIGSSRMVFLHPDVDEPLYLGEWKEEEGIKYSNETYKPKVIYNSFGSRHYHNHGASQIGYNSGNYWQRDYNNNSLHKLPPVTKETPTHKLDEGKGFCDWCGQFKYISPIPITSFGNDGKATSDHVCYSCKDVLNNQLKAFDMDTNVQD